MRRGLQCQRIGEALKLDTLPAIDVLFEPECCFRSRGSMRSGRKTIS